MNKVAKSILDLLRERGETIVFAESCTAGNIAAEFAKTPGASDCLCGSFVTYRPKMKKRILGVKKKTIAKYTTESPQVVEQMAGGAIERSGADWAAAVVGHFGPKAPDDKDGQVWVAIARYRKKGKISVVVGQHQLKSVGRVTRCKEATELVLANLLQLMKSCDESKTTSGDAVAAS